MLVTKQIIKDLMLRGKSKADIAKATNSQWQSVYYWEKGMFNPNLEKMRKLIAYHDEVMKGSNSEAIEKGIE